MTCECGHDYFDHVAVPNVMVSGAVTACRFSTCGCDQFTEKED